MENDTGTEADKSEDVVEDTDQETDTETTDYKALYEKSEAERREEAARRKRAESKLERERINSAVDNKVEKVLSKKEEQTGELNDAQIDFFELKGYDEDQIKVFENIMKRTGMNHREVLKDEYAIAKATAIKTEKEVKEAMPSNSKRSGNNQTNSVDYWLNKVESGSASLKDIPDFDTRAAVVAKREQKQSDNRPAWHK